MRRLLLVAIFIVTFSAHANTAASSKVVVFNSTNPWNASRWYLVGQLKSDRIEWLSGATTIFKSCLPKSAGVNVKASSIKLRKSGEQGLIGSGDWIAIPADPAVRTDSLEIVFSDKCQIKTNIEWAPESSASKRVLVPYLFLKPQGNVYMGYQFDITAPSQSNSADILLDIVGGGWKMNLGNAESGAKTSIYSVPLVEARGEWSPENLRGLGFELHMLQGMASFGGIEFQNILISQWMAGLYYQRLFSVSQGLVVRTHLNFFQHLADQGTDVESIGAYERNHRGIHFGLSFSQYFARRWHLQFRGDYGFPSNLADVGVEQSYLKFKSHVGYLVTESVTVLVEGSYRKFTYAGHNPTSALGAVAGLRLEL
jgi:hypothetical protein